jgi:endonuclease/exonuclease/phosphatase (EEP) superfamily protein YafD
VEKYCKEKDIEACAIRLHLPAYEIRIIAIHRAPSSNLQQSLQNLDELLYMVSDHKEDIIICGDININYFRDSYHKQQLDSLLASHRLNSVIHFPTRFQNNSYSSIDHILITKLKTKIRRRHVFTI